MKTHRLSLFVTAFSLTAFTATGCAEKAKPTEAAPVKSAAADPSSQPAAPPAPAPSAPAPSAPAQWSALKGYGFDQREQLLAGLKGLEARVDEQVSELSAKREALVASNTSTQAWDFAMQEMNNARTTFKSANADLEKATRETWDQLKDRVGDAWTRTQDAYAKVKASTTK